MSFLKINKQVFPISLGSRNLGASEQEALSAFQWSWLCSQLTWPCPCWSKCFTLVKTPNHLHLLSPTATLEISAQGPLCLRLYQGEKRVWDALGEHTSQQQKGMPNSIKSLELPGKKTLCTKKLLGKSKGYIKWKEGTLFLQTLRKV